MIKNFVKILKLLGDRLEVCVSVLINLKLSKVSNSTTIYEDCFAAYCYCWMNLFKNVQFV